MIVKYSKKFPYAPYLNEDIGFEMELHDNTGTGPIDPEKLLNALSFLKGVAERFHKEQYPHLYTEDGRPVIVKQVSNEDQAEADAEISRQLEETKIKMLKAETKKEAETIWLTSGFPFNIELKQILNGKTE